MMRATPSERFWRYVQKTDGCWLWTGHVKKGGYGQFSLTHTRPVGAHRYSYELHNGAVPAGLFVMHSCDTPACVNPAHLTIGTAKDNTADMIAKGRQLYPAAERRKAQTHCKRGHEFTPDNIYWSDHGRACRACALARLKRQRVA